MVRAAMDIGHPWFYTEIFIRRQAYQRKSLTRAVFFINVNRCHFLKMADDKFSNSQT